MKIINISAIRNQQKRVANHYKNNESLVNTSKVTSGIALSAVTVEKVAKSETIKDFIMNKISKLKIKNPKKTIDNATDIIDNTIAPMDQNTNGVSSKQNVGVNYNA